jgi:hypothetical protein
MQCRFPLVVAEHGVSVEYHLNTHKQYFIIFCIYNASEGSLRELKHPTQFFHYIYSSYVRKCLESSLSDNNYSFINNRSYVITNARTDSKTLVDIFQGFRNYPTSATH